MIILPRAILSCVFRGVLAAEVGVTPDGLPRAEATLIVCPDAERCADDIYWIQATGWVEEGGLHTVDTVVELDEQGWRDGTAPELAYANALAMAREEYAARRWSLVEAATRDGLHVLDRWDGTVANQDLWELRFLRGAARYARGEGLGDDIAFRHAAAVAWNRTVRMPEVWEGARDAYYVQLAAVLEQPPARVELGPTADDVVYFLDGVLLGPGPLAVDVLAGQHRVTAQRRHSEDLWRADLDLEPAARAHVQANFARLDDPGEVNARLARALLHGALDPAVADLLARWCQRESVHDLRVVMAEPVAPAEPTESEMPVYAVVYATFDAHLRALR